MSFRHLRNARSFFSDYYLGSVFGRTGTRGRRRKLSDAGSEFAFARFRRLYERAAGHDLSPADCRERFVRPLLREIFGFLLDETEDGIHALRPAAAVGSDEIAEPAQPVALAWIGGFDEDLDAGRGVRSPRRHLEAELARRGMQYGLLATGERLRLVRAAGEGPQGAYLEIDLAGLAEEPDPESFAIGWRVFSASSFIPGPSGLRPIDEYEVESRKHAEKVSEDLKGSVFRAAEALVGGLLADAGERGAVADPVDLAADDVARYRDAALVALYRLLFILYAEARDPRLDDHVTYRASYSASGLVDELLADPHRQWPENRSTLWPRCLALFEIYDRGLPPIDPWRNIPPRGGDFFRRDTPEGSLLAQAQLSDSTVGRLMLDLATTARRTGIGRERISFRELDIENLGAVYEGLLEYQPRVANGPVLELRVQGRVLFLSLDELARLCETKALALRGPVEWVAGTAAERFHPEGEAEDDEPDEEVAEDEDNGEDEDEEARESSGDGDGLKKGGRALLIRRLERGAFHFVPGPGRKGSGSFYTPRPLVEDLVRHALGPLATGKSAAEIEALRVLDPACGSGHFLVEAMRFLGQQLHRAYVREHGGKAPPAFRSRAEQGWDVECDAPDAEARAGLSEARAWCKRRIAERCLFGVDSNPTAVTLAHVALWIESAAGDRPLSYFEHHVRCGDSLLGSWLDRLDAPPGGKGDRRQKDVFAEKLRVDFRAAMADLAARTAKARELRRLIDELTLEDLEREGVDPDSPEELSYKENLRRESESVLAGARLLFNLRSASLFVPEIWRDWRGLTHLLSDPRALEDAACRHAWWPAFEELRARYRFFHWELEFPEVFLDAKRPGFDAVLGNPPWDKVLPERHAFYARVDPLIRAFKGAELDRRIRELHAAHPGLKERFDEFRQETKTVAQFLRSGGDFPHAKARSQAAHEDLSKYFLDRAIRLAAPGGAVALLVPSVIYNGDGCVGLRRYILNETRIERFYGFENRRKLFPIDSRYKFVCLVFRKSAEPTPFTAAFMRRDPDELTASGERPWMVRLSREEIERYSPDTLAFLEYRSPRDQEIVARMHAERPTLGSRPGVPGSWGARFVSWRAHKTIFNAGEDKDLWTDPATGEVYAPHTVLASKPAGFEDVGQEMRRAGCWPVFEGKNFDQFLVGIRYPRWWIRLQAVEQKYGKEPPAQPTLIFRRIARNTDERTMISAVLPEQSLGSETTTEIEVFKVGVDEAAAVLNSLAFDWLLRLRNAGTTLAFTYVRPMPVPPAEVVSRLPALATRLTWPNGLRHITDGREAWPRLWEINRAVAEAYGLDAEDFEHILAAFPVLARKRKEFFAYLAQRTAEWKAEAGRTRLRAASGAG